MNKTTSNNLYGIWVLRIWQEPDSGAWRSVVQDTRSERKRAFDSKQALQQFLDEEVIEVALDAGAKVTG